MYKLRHRILHCRTYSITSRRRLVSTDRVRRYSPCIAMLAEQTRATAARQCALMRPASIPPHSIQAAYLSEASILKFLPVWSFYLLLPALHWGSHTCLLYIPSHTDPVYRPLKSYTRYGTRIEDSYRPAQKTHLESFFQFFAQSSRNSAAILQQNSCKPHGHFLLANGSQPPVPEPHGLLRPSLLETIVCVRSLLSSFLLSISLFITIIITNKPVDAIE